MIDIRGQLDAIHRTVGKRPDGDGSEVIGVLLTRSYPAPIDDVWEALTDPGRVERWFLPLSGELRAGGSFRLEGNASGDILECEPPRRLKVTFGGPTSIVELRLTAEAEGDTTVELEHTVPIEMAGSTAGALYVGPGWDGAFMALDLFLVGEMAEDPVAAAGSPEAQEFSKQSVHLWRSVVEVSGGASDDEIAAATEVSLGQFAPDLAD